MSFASYSITPSQNLTIAGASIAEGSTSPGTINAAIRQIMADGRALFDQVSGINLASYAPINAPQFTGQPSVQGRGAVLHHDNANNASGRIFVRQSGAAQPALQNGDILLTYT